MSKYDIIGHKGIIDYFKKIHKADRLSHAYLFIGKEGIGKRKTAWHIAAYLNCAETQKPCFTCVNCTRIAQKTHPDIIEIEPKNSIGINDIKELQTRVYIKNYESTYKIIIIDEADKLTPDASNAFLKTLEEPPPDVIFFLITSKPENILATIKSRTHKIWFSLKLSESRQYLKEKRIPDSDIDFLLTLADGRLSMVQKLGTPAYLEKRKKIFSPPSLSFNLYDSDRKSLKNTLPLLLSFLRDCLFIKVGKADKVLNKDLMTKLSNYSNQFSVFDITDKLEQLFILNQTLDNININLANNIMRDILTAKDSVADYLTK